MQGMKIKETRMNLIRMVVAAGCLWATAVLADPPPGYPFVDFDAGLKAAHASGKPIFLYFGRYGCAWCEHTNKTTFSDAALKKLYSDNYELVYVDAESGKRLTLPSGERITEAELGARLQAFATPLFVYMTPQGDKIMQVPGFKTVQDFRDFDRYVRGGFYKQKTLLSSWTASREVGVPAAGRPGGQRACSLAMECAADRQLGARRKDLPPYGIGQPPQRGGIGHDRRRGVGRQPQRHFAMLSGDETGGRGRFPARDPAESDRVLRAGRGRIGRRALRGGLGRGGQGACATAARRRALELVGCRSGAGYAGNRGGQALCRLGR